MDGTYMDPPYNPEYNKSQPPHGRFSRSPCMDEDGEEDNCHYEDRPQHRRFKRSSDVSEGYEVRTIDQEEMMRQYAKSQSHLTALARAQGRADRDEEGNNYDASDVEDENDDNDGRSWVERG